MPNLYYTLLIVILIMEYLSLQGFYYVLIVGYFIDCNIPIYVRVQIHNTCVLALELIKEVD